MGSHEHTFPGCLLWARYQASPGLSLPWAHSELEEQTHHLNSGMMCSVLHSGLGVLERGGVGEDFRTEVAVCSDSMALQ